MSCLSCKYQGVPIDAFSNWCYHPTHPDGAIVLTRTECNEWKKSKKEKMFEELKQKKMSNNQPEPLYEKASCQIERYMPPSMAKRRRKVFSDEYKKKRAKAFLGKYFGGE